jgi:hypothetical protein
MDTIQVRFNVRILFDNPFIVKKLHQDYEDLSFQTIESLISPVN